MTPVQKYTAYGAATLVILAAVIIWLSSMSAQSTNDKTAMPAGSEYLYDYKDQRKVVWIEKGKDAIRARLKDADSAQFRGLFFSDAVAPIVCGEVNGKNSFGSKSGYVRFITTTKAETTILETDMKRSEFAISWRKLCVE